MLRVLKQSDDVPEHGADLDGARELVKVGRHVELIVCV